MRHTWIAIALASLVLATVGCPKRDATGENPPGAANPLGNNQPFAEGRTENGGFITEATEEPLDGSPLNLWGFSLGTRLDAHNDKYAGKELDLTQEWREGELTGIQWRKLQPETGDAKPDSDISYFHNGELVGSQRMVSQTEEEFGSKAGLLSAKYGDPVEAIPAFVRDSLIYGDLLEDDPDQLLLWVDPGTRTAIAGRYDGGKGTAMWLLFHPERFDAAQGDTFAGMGS